MNAPAAPPHGKVCTVGTSAIGGFIGTRLAATGTVQASALAHGATLEALRTHGWRMDTANGRAHGAVHAAALPFAQVLGCGVHAGTATSEPGLVVLRMGLIVGEPRGGTSPRAQQVAALLAAAGFDATASENVRCDIWYKPRPSTRSACARSCPH